MIDIDAPRYRRKEVASLVGISYSTLRIYEKALGDMLMVQTRMWRGNATKFYSLASLTVLRRAIERRKEGVPFKFLRDPSKFLSNSGLSPIQRDRDIWFARHATLNDGLIEICKMLGMDGAIISIESVKKRVAEFVEEKKHLEEEMALLRVCSRPGCPSLRTTTCKKHVPRKDPPS